MYMKMCTCIKSNLFRNFFLRIRVPPSENFKTQQEKNKKWKKIENKVFHCLLSFAASKKGKKVFKATRSTLFIFSPFRSWCR